MQSRVFPHLLRVCYHTPQWIVDGYFGWTASLAQTADVIVLVQVLLRTALWRIFWRHLIADLRRDNPHPGWITLFRFMRVVRSQYRSNALPEAEHEPREAIQFQR